MKYLRSRDMRKMFGISVGTLYNWRKQGMPYVGADGPGLSMFYDEDKVLEWLSNREVTKIEKEKEEVKEVVEDLYGEK